MNKASTVAKETVWSEDEYLVNLNVSAYITSYLEQSKAEAETRTHPAWLRDFFSAFHKGLRSRCANVAAGDRNVVTSTLAKSLDRLLPSDIKLHKEVALKDFLSFGTSGALSALLNKKKVDFVLERKDKRLLIEFKTNLNFNDLSAAMIEMLTVKKFVKSRASITIKTSSLHLFPFTANVEGLKALNEGIGSPLDHIWVLCSPGSNVRFDIEAINNFRVQVDKCLA